MNLKTPDPAKGTKLGATLALGDAAMRQAELCQILEQMRQDGFNTVNFYGLERVPDQWEPLFQALERLRMQAVVRIEDYGAGFSFLAQADLPDVLARYQALLDYVCEAPARRCVAYFALNMPVDDGVVQENLGGVNSDTSKRNQVEYATEIVRLMREETAANGFSDAKMYLSVFYGWDNTYEIPSYAAAGADGYFINNYSYPDGPIPTAEDDDDTLINADRLRVSMDTYLSQYGDAPVVIECGFHTMEYNGGAATNQTAGLVADVAAKRRAMRAMVNFYQQNYPQVRGILYFGYNLFKEEGSPPTVMDWSLEYPTRDTMPAAEGLLENGAQAVEDAAAVSGWAVQLAGKDDGIAFSECPPVQQLVVRYRADQDVRLGLYTGGDYKKSVTLPASADYAEVGVLLTVVEDYDLSLRAENEAGLRLDQVLLLDGMEAEYALLEGAAQAVQDEAASRGSCVTGLDKGAVRYEESRGGDTLAVTYRCKADSTLTLRAGDRQFELALPASDAFTTVKAELGLASGASFSLSADQPDFALDRVQLSGAPVPGGAGAQTGAEEETPPEEPAASPAPWIAAGGITLVLAVGLLLLLRTRAKRKEEAPHEE